MTEESGLLQSMRSQRVTIHMPFNLGSAPRVSVRLDSNVWSIEWDL